VPRKIESSGATTKPTSRSVHRPGMPLSVPRGQSTRNVRARPLDTVSVRPRRWRLPKLPALHFREPRGHRPPATCAVSSGRGCVATAEKLSRSFNAARGRLLRHFASSPRIPEAADRVGIQQTTLQSDAGTCNVTVLSFHFRWRSAHVARCALAPLAVAHTAMLMGRTLGSPWKERARGQLLACRVSAFRTKTAPLPLDS